RRPHPYGCVPPVGSDSMLLRTAECARIVKRRCGRSHVFVVEQDTRLPSGKHPPRPRRPVHRSSRCSGNCRARNQPESPRTVSGVARDRPDERAVSREVSVGREEILTMKTKIRARAMALAIGATTLAVTGCGRTDTRVN